MQLRTCTLTLLRPWRRSMAAVSSLCVRLWMLDGRNVIRVGNCVCPWGLQGRSKRLPSLFCLASR